VPGCGLGMSGGQRVTGSCNCLRRTSRLVRVLFGTRGRREVWRAVPHLLRCILRQTFPSYDWHADVCRPSSRFVKRSVPPQEERFPQEALGRVLLRESFLLRWNHKRWWRKAGRECAADSFSLAVATLFAGLPDFSGVLFGMRGRREVWRRCFRCSGAFCAKHSHPTSGASSAMCSTDHITR